MRVVFIYMSYNAMAFCTKSMLRIVTKKCCMKLFDKTGRLFKRKRPVWLWQDYEK